MRKPATHRVTKRELPAVLATAEMLVDLTERFHEDVYVLPDGSVITIEETRSAFGVATRYESRAVFEPWLAELEERFIGGPQQPQWLKRRQVDALLSQPGWQLEEPDGLNTFTTSCTDTR